MKRTLLLLIFVLSEMVVCAQADNRAVSTPSTSRNVLRADVFLSGRDQAENRHIQNLMNEVQASVYVESGNVKVYGNQPVCLFTDASSFATLGNLDVTRDIEMITVKFKKPSDLNSPLDFSLLSAFPKLRYVYLLSEITTTEPKMVSLVTQNVPRYNVFYNILITH